MRAFEELVGSKPMHLYTEHDFVAFKDKLLLAPTYANQIAGCKTLADAIAWNAAQPPHKRRQTLSTGTINEGYLTFVRQVFSHAKTNRHAPAALGQDVSVASTPGERRWRRREDARHAFSLAKLQKIFREPLFLGAPVA